MSNLPAPKVSTDLGHAPVWDPPAAMTAALRWTCPCGATVLDYRGNVYGSATERPCPPAEAVQAR